MVDMYGAPVLFCQCQIVVLLPSSSLGVYMLVSIPNEDVENERSIRNHYKLIIHIILLEMLFYNDKFGTI